MDAYPTGALTSWQMMSLLRVREFAVKTFASAQEFPVLAIGIGWLA